MNDHGQPPLQLDPLIEAATRNLRDNPEHRIAAAGFLETLRQPGDDEAAKTIARWDEIDSRKPGRPWARAAVVACLLLVLGIVGCDLSRFVRVYEWTGWLFELETDSSKVTRKALERLSSRATAEQRFTLFGTAAPADVLNGRKSVWEKHPDDPAQFSFYAMCHLRAYESLPEGFLETARRIDPDNAWFVYLAAAMEARRAVQRDPRKYQTVGGKRVADPSTWKILKPEAYAKSIELVREAGRLPRFDSYRAANARMALGVLPDGDFEEYVDSNSYLGQMVLGGKLRLRPIMDVLATSSWQAGVEGNRQAYESARDDGERMLRLLMSDETSGIVDELLNQLVAGSMATALAEASASLAWEEERMKWQAIRDRFQTLHHDKRSREFIVDGQVMDSRHFTGSLVGFAEGMAGLQRQVAKPPPLSARALRPCRMLEHEMLSWMFCWIVFAVMAVLLAGFVLYRFRIAPLVRMVAERFESLLGPRDHLMILGGGLLLPFLLVTAINRLTPWGVMTISLQGTDLLLPMTHFAGLVVLWLLGSWWIVRWRLAKRAETFGFTCPGSWLSVPLLSALALFPIVGVLVDLGVTGTFWDGWRSLPTWFMEHPEENREWLWAAFGVFVFPCIVLLIAAATALVGGNNGMLRQAVVARVMARVCAVAMLVCAVASVGFKWAERHWFKVDIMMKLDPSIPSWNRYEYQCALQMREELHELLDGRYRSAPETGR
jgi:hypothetical protein